MEIAVGPQLTLPTATDDGTGTGKWQGGFAVLAIAPRKFGIAGALVTWQHSFAGDDDRASQHNLSLQLGGGIGKVWVRPGATINAFAEPQFTVAHDGAGQPSSRCSWG